MKKKLALLWMLLSLPFALSLNPIVYDADYVAQYQSPEGIRFLSYTAAWDESKLQALYQELLQNQHGAELSALREVRVRGEEHERINGEYNPATHAITLYDGNRKQSAASMRNVLSHEYGHHFAFYYVPQHVLPMQTTWKTLRGAEDAFSLAFWKYKAGYHEWFTSEIFADDYMMLYGTVQEVNRDTIEDDTVFQQMTKHENEELPNVFEEAALQNYLEKRSGLAISQDRLIQTPTFQSLQNNIITFQTTKRDDILYRFSFDYYESNPKGQTQNHWVHRGVYEWTSSSGRSTISIPVEDTMLPEQQDFMGSVHITVEAVDLHTNLGLEAELLRLPVHEGSLSS